MSKKLLLADDSITIQKVIGITFANEDYSLEIVDNGEDAFKKALADQPDLILADVYMPGKNGYELCDSVKKEPKLTGVPVLLLTGTFEPFDEDRAQAVGADDWIAKPFESQVLIDKVEELLLKGGRPAPVAEVFTPSPEAQDQPVQSPPSPFAAAEESSFDNLLADGADDLLDEPQTWAEDSSAQVQFEEESVFSETEEMAAFEEASEEEDLWGAVSLEEETLMEEFSEEEPVGDDLWGNLNEEMRADDLSAEGEEEILTLDEVDILDEEELPLGMPEDEVISFGEEEVPSPNEPAEPPEKLSAQPGEFAFEEEEFLLGEEEGDGPGEEQAFEAVVSEGSSIDAPGIEETSFAGLAEETEFEADKQVCEPVMPVAANSVLETQVQALSENDLARIVEQVAAKVLEKIAWEVVPDLAENMIKEEIRKLKEGTV